MRGIKRSKYCARWLADKGFETQFGGVDDKALNPLSQDMVLWADMIVIAHEHHKKWMYPQPERALKKLLPRLKNKS